LLLKVLRNNVRLAVAVDVSQDEMARALSDIDRGAWSGNKKRVLGKADESAA